MNPSPVSSRFRLPRPRFAFPTFYRSAVDACGRLGVLLVALCFGADLSAAPKTSAESAKLSASLTPGGGRIVVEAEGIAPEVPFLFSALGTQSLTLTPHQILNDVELKLHVIQGRPDVFTFGLQGDGEVVAVVGPQVRDWSVRAGAGAANAQRFLDIRLNPATGTPAPAVVDTDITVRTRAIPGTIPGGAAPVLVTAGRAVGFNSRIGLESSQNLDYQITDSEGLLPVGKTDDSEPGVREFYFTGEGRLALQLRRRGTVADGAELLGVQLGGKLNEAGRSVDFRLRGQFRAKKAGARLPVLWGGAALSERGGGDGWRVELAPGPGDDDAPDFTYDLVAEREGTFAVDLGFAAALSDDGDWQRLDFQMPAGAVVPLRIDGVDAGVEFDKTAAVIPGLNGRVAEGFLPADGHVKLGWKRTRRTEEGALFFASSEKSDVRVGAGLLRQISEIEFRILQGKLAGVRLRLEGAGEILGVEGSLVAGWKVVTAGDARALEVQLSRPIEGTGTLVIRSQSALGNFPVRAEPLRFTPEAAIRHSGFVRVANTGAVRLEVADAEGLLQLAPAQYPGAAAEAGARQVFVYRFPSASYAYRVVANQIQAEVGVSQIVTCELGETDRILNADLELDVREAPLRDWSLKIPADYTVVSVLGNDVADTIAETAAAQGHRTLKILFRRPVEGRQLLQLRLEKNQPAGAGEWQLPALVFPEARSVRGHIGAVAAPGYRLVPARADRLVEVPLSYFPRQTAGLQQAWRLRETDWAAAVQIEALGQSVQADVFHLYSLKEGVVYGSTLINYFVVGAPANEWRIEVPATVGNIDVVGQNVRRDWRREGGQIVVSLHQPVLGAATVLVTFEQPMSARGGTIRPGEVRPLGVQGERGFVQVVSPLQVKHQIARAEGGLLRLEPLELPTEFRLLSTSPSLAVYQYTARPFALEMNVDWYQPGETVDQVVDFAKLASRVSRDGQVVTDARFFVKTRGRKALRFALAEETKLWEARVDNEVVNARADGAQTLIPLPARLNPNEPVEVALRLGTTGGHSSSTVELTAPRMLAPTVINEWTVRGDAGRVLVAKGGNAELLTPSLTETGFEWITPRWYRALSGLFVLIAFSIWLLRAENGWRVPVGIVLCTVAAIAALILAREAWVGRRVNLATLTYAATMVRGDEPVTIRILNTVAWRAMLSWPGVALAVGGLGLLAAAWVKRATLPSSFNILLVAGAVAIASGLLLQHAGASLFFAALAVSIVLAVLALGIARRNDDNNAGEAGQIGTTPPEIPPAPPATSGAAPGTVSAFAFAALLAASSLHTPQARAAGTESWLAASEKTALSLVQTWSIRETRLTGEAEVTVRGRPGESFLLLNAPAVLTDFKGDGLRITKATQDGQAAYYIAPEREGTFTARFRFEMTLPEPRETITVPTGPAAAQRIAVDLDQPGWEFTSNYAVQILPTPGLGETRSGATLLLAPADVVQIQIRPRRRDVATETTQFFAEVAQAYLPGPGVVNGYARVTVRPAQGRVSELELQIPAGFTVGDVARGPVGTWRFDPEKRRLRVAIEPAQTAAFKFDLELQRGAGALPLDLSLEPLRVVGAAGEVGMLALAFCSDAQPEGVQATGLSPVNLQDFDASILPRGTDRQPLGTLQHVWRYSQAGGSVALKAAPVAPEVRVSGRQVFSLDDDRLVMAADLVVTITRGGLFKLSFALPETLEVEALSGPALNHWTEAREGTARIVTLHLNGRTLGEQKFTLTLAGAAPRAQDAWSVPQLVLREATRQTGELLVVPGKGIRLRVAEREKVTQLDPRSAGGLQPGTLAFRLLQEGWTLRLGIEALDPWVTVQALQEVTLREGQTLTRIGLRYRVENAAVKQLRVRLPGLSLEQIATVRATGSAVSDFVRTDEPEIWELRFKRGIAGETDAQIEFQGQAARAENRESVATPVFVGSRQTTLFVDVRTSGRLELEAGDLPRGWQRVDWSNVPTNLQDHRDRSVPALGFRVAEPEAPLAVSVRRHEVADALKLRVKRGSLTTIFSPAGTFLTSVDLQVDVLEKSTLQVRLPAGSQLFNTFVNGESVPVVREGAAHLFYVTPNSEADRSAVVRLVYSTTAAARDASVALVAPGLSVPLENVAWRVVVPPGYELNNYAGTLRLQDERIAGWFGLEQYQSLTTMKRSAESRKGVALLEQASALLQKGQQQQAGEILARATNTVTLDAASNEDARVQLRALKTQQAVLGLNTRRQRLYLDNRVDAARNEQLEQAATLNPFMQGKTDFDPQQVDQLLMGNTAEENSALRGIAARLVDQQLVAEPAPGAIDLTLPERGRVLTFTRSLQVDGGAPLELRLEVARTSRINVTRVALMLLGIAALAAMVTPRRATR
jgi:hypothetical protein